ncbi:FCN1-like protein, partial [Mya arenaria]
VFQHRFNGSVDFYKNLRSYEVGFGSLHGEFWQVTLPGNLYPYHNGLAFSTFDHDQDSLSRTNCAKLEHGAWWYNECYYANLNGQYFVPGTHNAIGMTYDAFMGTVSLKESKMMFK